MTIADEGGVSYLHHRQKRIPIKKIIIIINIKIDIFIITMDVVANLSFCNRVPGLTTSLLLGKHAPQDLIMIVMMTIVVFREGIQTYYLVALVACVDGPANLFI